VHGCRSAEATVSVLPEAWILPESDQPPAEEFDHAAARLAYSRRDKKPNAAAKKAMEPKWIELVGGPNDGKSLRVKHDLTGPIMLDLGRACYVRRRGTNEWHHEEPPCPE
jgi:hypothetical protein